jgi:hypothetical protein
VAVRSGYRAQGETSPSQGIIIWRAIVDYPALYTSSDLAAVRAQSTYYRFVKLQLGLLLLVSISSSLIPIIPVHRQEDLSIVIALLLCGGIAAMWIARVRQYDRLWFGCRAIAESVKTTSWRYAMRGRPFDSGDAALTDRQFVETLAEIRRTWPRLEGYITAPGGGRELTESMKALCGRPLEDRRSAYVEGRLRDEKRWYESKCALNRSRAGQSFWLAIILQGAALLIALFQARYGLAPINLVSLLMTTAAASVAWSQARRHEELVQAYGVAANELNELEAVAESVDTEGVFKDFIEQAEEAISREHTMWCARRDVQIRRI